MTESHAFDVAVLEAFNAAMARKESREARQSQQREAHLWNIEQSRKALGWLGFEVKVVVEDVRGRRQADIRSAF